MNFADHFAPAAADYAKFRPAYPAELTAWLAAQAPARDLAWDVGTGNGQVARDLAQHFTAVIATDASAEQIRHAEPSPGINYRCEPAERTQQPDHSVDVVTVAQALHWFDRPAFFAETARVLKAGGLLAVWTYNLARIDPAIDACVDQFYHEVVGPYWPAERRMVENGYADIDLPGQPLTVPAWQMAERWTLRHLIGYLGTWSASIRCREATGHDPREALLAPLTAAWGDAPERTVSWPLLLRVSRLG